MPTVCLSLHIDNARLIKQAGRPESYNSRGTNSHRVNSRIHLLKHALIGRLHSNNVICQGY